MVVSKHRCIVGDPSWYDGKGDIHPNEGGRRSFRYPRNDWLGPRLLNPIRSDDDLCVASLMLGVSVCADDSCYGSIQPDPMGIDSTTAVWCRRRYFWPLLPLRARQFIPVLYPPVDGCCRMCFIHKCRILVPLEMHRASSELADGLLPTNSPTEF